MRFKKNIVPALVFLVMATAGGFVFVNYFLPSNTINADVVTSQQSKQLIQDGDFSKTAEFSSYLWTRLSNGGNVPEIKGNFLNLSITSSGKDSYHTIGQSVALQKSMTYKISIVFENSAKSSKDFKALAGFSSPSIVSKPISSYDLDLSKTEQSTFTAEFSPKENYKNGYFVFKEYGGIGELQISSISVTEQSAAVPTATATVAPSATDSAVTKPEALTATISSPTTTPTVSPTASAAARLTSTPSATPIAIETVSPVKSTSIAVPSGWSFAGFPSSVNTTSFTEKNLKVYRMLGTEWQIATAQNKKLNFSTLPQDGLYIYNTKDSEVPVEVQEIQPSVSPQYPSAGWNVLYNGEDSPASATSLIVNLKKDSSSISDLIAQDKASKSFYYLKQTSQGVALVNCNFDQDKVPAKSAYWIYLF